MAEKGEAEIPAISLSISGENIDSGQDPEDSDAHTSRLEVFRVEKEEEKEGEKDVGGEQQGKEEEEEGKDGEGEKNEKEEDADIFRDAKRRKKNCPAALEKSLSSNRGFSFSFDTKIGPIESTPKFGSFNLGLGGSDFEGISLGLGLGLGYEGDKGLEGDQAGVKTEERDEKGI